MCIGTACHKPRRISRSIQGVLL